MPHLPIVSQNMAILLHYRLRALVSKYCCSVTVVHRGKRKKTGITRTLYITGEMQTEEDAKPGINADVTSGL